MVTVDAMFDGKVLHPMAPLDIAPNTRVTIVVQDKSVSPLTETEEQELIDRFERHFGEITTNDPTGLDNEQIDADLAREYGNSHQDE